MILLSVLTNTLALLNSFYYLFIKITQKQIQLFSATGITVPM